MRSSVASALFLAFALSGPAIVATVSSYAAGAAPAFVVHILSVASIALIVLAAFATALRIDGLAWRSLGFEGVSWSSVPIGLVLAIFFMGYGAFAWRNFGVRIWRGTRASVGLGTGSDDVRIGSYYDACLSMAARRCNAHDRARRYGPLRHCDRTISHDPVGLMCRVSLVNSVDSVMPTCLTSPAASTRSLE